MLDSGVVINVPGMHFARKGKNPCNQEKSNENYTME